MGKTVYVDQDECISCGLCVDNLPDVFRFADNGKAEVHAPAGAPEDGVERGIAAFIGCSSLIRQFEFAMNVWVNDPKFKDLDNERDPIVGNHDGTFDMTIPRRPIRKRLRGLPAFTTIRGGAYFFLPGVRALRFLASGQAEHVT